MNTEFTLSRDNDKIYLSIKATAVLDKETTLELIDDLKTHYLNMKALEEAKEQNASKLKLEKKLREVFVDIFDTDGIDWNKSVVITPNIKRKLK